MATPSPFPQDLPERTQAPSGSHSSAWKSQSCPGMRSCWNFSLSSYSLATSDKAILARRICMLAILGCRTAVSVLAVISQARGGSIAGLILSIILAILGFWFIAWCLAKIGDAQGWRKVFGLSVGRWHFDVFLFVMAIVHIVMLVGAIFNFSVGGLSAGWLVMWLLIFAVAWVAMWEPEPQNSGSYV